MPKIYEPKVRHVAHNDESYKLNIQVLDEKMLTVDDEELIEAMAMYKPKTMFREGDLAFLLGIPDYYSDRPFLPRVWKIRFIVSYWAWNLMRLLTDRGGSMTLAQAKFYMEQNKYLHGGKEHRKPMIYAHGYPHGMYPDTAAWLPESMLRRTVMTELTQEWRPIVEESDAPFLGYDMDTHNSRFVLDIAPLKYGTGPKRKNPFRAEESLCNDLYKIQGMDQLLEIPMYPNEQDRVRRLDPDHDIYVTDDDEEHY